MSLDEARIFCVLQRSPQRKVISDTQLQEVSVKEMRKIFLLATMVKDQSRINEEQTRFFIRCSQHHFLETARGEDESAHSQIIAIPATSN